MYLFLHGYLFLSLNFLPVLQVLWRGIEWNCQLVKYSSATAFIFLVFLLA
jgi:hypothetical protein